MRYQTPVLYSTCLKKKERVTALQDKATVKAGAKYKNPYEDRPLRTIDDPIVDGCPYAGHVGIDFGCGRGTPVYALFSGRIWTTYSVTGGNRLKILTKSGLAIGYNHLDRFAVKSGQYVKQGDLVAYSGATGTKCFGAHLHVDGNDASGRMVDIYPYVFGQWDEWGRGKKTVSETVLPNYPNTDKWEKALDKPRTFKAKDVINVRKSPGTDKAIVSKVKKGQVFNVDKWCALPNGQIWARLQGLAWHWVALFHGNEWLAEEQSEHLFDLVPPATFTPLESIQGYASYGWNGGYKPIVRAGERFTADQQYNDGKGNSFVRRQDNKVWYVITLKGAEKARRG